MVVTVADADISRGLDIAARQGVYVERTSAVVVAAMQKLGGRFRSPEVVAGVLTGHGLKNCT